MKKKYRYTTIRLDTYSGIRKTITQALEQGSMIGITLKKRAQLKRLKQDFKDKNISKDAQIKNIRNFYRVMRFTYDGTIDIEDNKIITNRAGTPTRDTFKEWGTIIGVKTGGKVETMSDDGGNIDKLVKSSSDKMRSKIPQKAAPKMASSSATSLKDLLHRDSGIRFYLRADAVNANRILYQWREYKELVQHFLETIGLSNLEPDLIIPIIRSLYLTLSPSDAATLLNHLALYGVDFPIDSYLPMALFKYAEELEDSDRPNKDTIIYIIEEFSKNMF